MVNQEARDDGWQWHQLNQTQIICTSLKMVNHASTTSLKPFAGQMPFLQPNQQRQSTEGIKNESNILVVVQWHPQGVVESLVITLVQIYFWVTRQKNFKHHSTKLWAKYSNTFLTCDNQW